MRALLSTVLGLSILSGCSAQTSSGSKETVVVAATNEVGEDGGDITVSSGSGVSIAPGTLVAGTDVTVATVSAPSEFSVDGATPASESIEILAKDSSGNPLDSVSQPMTIKLAIDDSASLLLAESGVDNLCVFLKSRQSELYVWRRSAITLNESGLEASVKSLKFGVFRLVYCGEQELPGFADASAEISGDDSATGDSATSGKEYTVNVVIPSSIRDFGHKEICAGLLLHEDGDKEDCSESWCHVFEMTVLNWAKATAKVGTEQKLSFVVSEAEMNQEKGYLMAFGFSAKDSCVLKNEVIDGKTKTVSDALFIYEIEKTSVTKGLTAKLGSSSFGLKKKKLYIGSDDASSVATPSAMPLCIETDTEIGHSMISANMDANGLVNGVDGYEMLVADDGTNSVEFSVRVGSGCVGVTPESLNTDSSTGLPYYARVLLTPAETAYFAPVDLQLGSSLTGTYSGFDGCLMVTRAGMIDSNDRDDHLASSVLDLGVTNPYHLLVPFVKNSNGEPRYDFAVGVLSTSTMACEDVPSASWFASEDRLLNPTITVPEPI